MSKSFRKVISPHKYIPEIINSSEDFKTLWETNKPWVFSNISHIAYFKKDKAFEFLNELGAKKIFFYDYDGAQAFLSIWDDKAILVFRGTQSIENPKKKHRKLSSFRKVIIKLFIKFPINPFSLLFLNNDLLADFKFFQKTFKPYKKVNVHSGFLEELTKIWDNKNTHSDVSSDISKDLLEHTENIPVWVTGHSLGGAMATLAGMKYPFEAVTTFGEPRVGRNIDLAFQSKSHTRYVNGVDPVTTLPPKFWSYYQHHGNKKQVYDEDSETNIIFDHSIIYYSENINR